MTVVWRTKLVMSIALFLVKPYRSTTIDLHLRTERDHRRLHGRFYVPPVITDQLATRCSGVSHCDVASTLGGTLHAVVRCPLFRPKDHPAHLTTTVERLYREYMFSMRRCHLGTLLWSTCTDIALLTRPFRLPHVSSSSVGGAPHYDCFYVTANATVMSAEITYTGNCMTLESLLSQWSTDGCTTTALDQRCAHRYVGVQLPVPFLTAVVSQVAPTLCLCDIWKPRCINILKYLGGGHVQQANDLSDAPHTFTLDAGMFDRAATLLRGDDPLEGDPESLAPSRDSVIDWLQTIATYGLDKHHAQHRLRQTPPGTIYTYEKLILALQLCTHLKGDAHLTDTVRLTADLVGLPSSVTDNIQLPSRATLCRWRFYVTAALCSLLQTYFDTLVHRAELYSEEFVCFFLCDGSPRVGREWLLMELYFILTANLETLFALQAELTTLTAAEPRDTTAIAVLERKMRDLLVHLPLAPSGMGIGCTSLPAKFHSVLHTFRCCIGTSWATVRAVMLRVLSVTTDFGTESGIAAIPATCPDQSFAFWMPKSELVGDASDLENDTIPTPPPPSPSCAFSESLPVPGSEHVAHGAFRHVLSKLKHQDEWMVGCRAVGKMLGSVMYRDRISERLLQGPFFAEARRQMRESFKQPVDHRFLNILLFLHDLLPLMLLFRYHWQPHLVFTNTPKDGDTSDQTITKETYIDQSAVTRAFRSDWWWGHAIMLMAVGFGPEHFVHFCRTCTCHHVETEHPPLCAGVIDYVQWRRKLHQSHRQRPCICKGMVSGELATGRGEQIIRTAYATLGQYLLLDFNNIAKSSSDNIMMDWETATHHVIFEMLVKITMWMQHPLCVCALACQDTAKAVHHIGLACDQYDRSSSSPKHMALTHRVFGAGPLRSAIDTFRQSGGLVVLPILRQLVLKLKCVRCNEISVESLHRFGSELQRMAPHHSAAYIGFRMLIPLLSVQKLFHIDALAQACAKLHTDLQILTRFEFQDHPTVVAHRNRLMVDGHRMVSMRRGVYKMVRQVFFRCDLHTMFASFPSIASSIAQHTKALKAADATSYCPLKELLNVPDVTDDVATHCLQCRYGLQHLRETLSGDEVLVLPANHSATIVPLTHVMGAHRADAFEEEHIDFHKLVVGQSSAPQRAVRVLNLHPKRRKLIQSAVNELRTDHIAVVPYNVDFRSKTNRAMHITSSIHQDSNENVEVLSLETLLSIGASELPKVVLKCDMQPDSLYHFSTSSLPTICHTQTAWDLITALMNACAYPGPSRMWAAPSHMPHEWGLILHHLLDAELVETVNDGFRLTPAGFVRVQRSRGTHNPRHAFRVSSKKELMDYTQWELLQHLLALGWTGSRFRPRVTPPAIELDPNHAVVDVFFFNKDLQVSRSYLLTLSNTLALAQHGVKKIEQKQLVRYYDNLIHVLRPDAPLPTLEDAEWDDTIHALDDPLPTDDLVSLQALGEPDSDGASDVDPDDDIPVDSEVVAADASENSEVVSADAPAASITLGTSRWGPFTFRAVVQHKTEHKWVVRCPHHKDDGDAPGTFCSKSLAFNSAAQQASTRSMLRQWALEGRHKLHRGIPTAMSLSHRYVEPRGLVLVSDAEQDRLLHSALLAPTWIVADGAGGASDSSEMGSNDGD